MAGRGNCWVRNIRRSPKAPMAFRPPSSSEFNSLCHVSAFVSVHRSAGGRQGRHRGDARTSPARYNHSLHQPPARHRTRSGARHIASFRCSYLCLPVVLIEIFFCY